MIGFHIDMNVAQFTRAYLERWLKEIAKRGYDTIIWEIENNVKWDTCPECVSPDAFTKAEFQEILGLCRELKLEPIPLLQTIGHCEYVLKHDKYKHMAEVADRIDQYCPRNPNVVPFLHKWIDEYLELFGDVKYFHIGADEAWTLGHCDACSLYARKHSLSDLYIDHINAVSSRFKATNITPIIWADMVLHHNEALDKLSRDIMLFDWMYDIHRGDGQVKIWGRGKHSVDELSKEELDKFGKHLFPHGDEPGRDPETFYTADYLADHGFKVVMCPSSASAGDSIFTPRHWFHVVNTFDSFHKGESDHLAGAVLTSWTVRLHPWELQTSAIDIPGFLAANPDANIQDFQKSYSKDRFGLDDNSIWEACGLLSKVCSLMESYQIGFEKHTLAVPSDTVQRQITEWADKDELNSRLRDCVSYGKEYRQGLEKLKDIAGRAKKGQDLLALWILAAQNLINRSDVTAFLLRTELSQRLGIDLAESHWQNGRALLDQMRELKAETEVMYRDSLKPTRRAEIISWIYDSTEYAMVSLLQA
ncbi:MAG: family 20 glycosylhydrolase [Sedimentisphaerales bacterium]|nr:family 20 glycosylhydrolase [Sedimentisphaerales bacterium]